MYLNQDLHVLLCLILWSISHHFSFVFQSIGEELVSLEKGSIEGCQAFIKKHSQNLHPNHYYLMVSTQKSKEIGYFKKNCMYRIKVYYIDNILCFMLLKLSKDCFEKKIFAGEKLSHLSPDSD